MRTLIVRSGLAALFAAVIAVPAFAGTATTTTLAVTVAGSAVTTTTPGTLVTLTATVKAGSTNVNPGQVYICDATATYCQDIHIIGKGMLTTAGTFTYRFYPGSGVHQYKAYFLGTTTYTTSTSAASSLTVMASSQAATSTTITSSGSAGNYTLTATTTGSLAVSPSGTTQFLDTSNSNSVIASASPLSTGAVNTKVGPYSGGNSPQAIAVGDFNNDGIPDIAVADTCNVTSGTCGYGPILIYLGNGDGTFRAGTTITGAYDALTDISVGDFNGDGNLDVVVFAADNLHTTYQHEQVFLGKGDGTFTGPVSYTFNQEGQNVVVNCNYQTVGDFNNDGKLDVAVGCEESGYSVVLLGNGDGSFSRAANVSSEVDTFQAASADFDGDGNLDLAVGIAGDNIIELKKGKGDGTFTNNGQVALPATGGTAASVGWIAFADVNNDGHTDLVTCDYNNNKVYIYLGNGSGSFPSTPSTTFTTGNNPTFVSVADFNGDGKADIAVQNFTDNTVTYYLGNGDGTFKTTPYSTVTLGTGPYYLAIGDFNKDGRIDLANMNQTSLDINIVLNSQPVATATATGVSVPGTGGSTHAVKASYPGDTYNAASSSGTVNLTASANATSTTVTLGATAAAVGDTVSLMATITSNGSAAAGTVTFYDKVGSTTTTVGTASVSGTTATLSYIVSTSGTHTITAAFTSSNTGAFLSSADTTGKMLTVSAGADTPSAYTYQVQQGATVQIPVILGYQGSVAPTGTVTFQVDSSNSKVSGLTCVNKVKHTNCSILYNSTGSTIGNHSVNFSQAADANFTSSSYTGTLQVSVAPLGIARPALSNHFTVPQGRSITLSVTLSAGAVLAGTAPQFLVDGSAANTSVATCFAQAKDTFCVADFAATSVAPGDHAVSVTGTGTDGNSTSTNAGTLTVR